MIHDNNQQRARNQRASRTTSRLYSTGLLTVLFLLLASVGANKSMTQGKKPARDQQPDECKAPRSRTVQIQFHGLFFFSFPKGAAPGSQYRDEGRVGILSTRQDHMLYIRYYSDGPVLTFPHLALQSQPQDMVIDKSLPDGRGVSILGSEGMIEGWGKPEHRDRKPASDPPYNFNWIIDVEGSELHGRNIDEEEDSLRPVLHIKTGTFRTAHLSSYKYYTVHEGVVSPFGFVADTIEVVVQLGINECLVANWGGHPLTVPGDVTLIELFNVRPDHAPYYLANQNSSNQAKAMSDMHLPLSDDFHIYYDDLLKVSNRRNQFYFLPDLSESYLTPEDKLRRRFAVPFICFGTGGSKE